ncbi:zinc-ribbon and DUF3426 domain-containing protein [Rhizobacter sp. Root1221]|uniref:zinc-ribbon and DUF3426 domain-containing protein n=1 Tax=Rhizobacter sp. Root1221 TaxID=1736433 RepID=UPI0006F55165|nr:zinc-ribbon and DUF3426 domain-containing protein [Rhizobacter sp. Root1221]KQV94428.1 hypothetical protein ASC87_26340 [Rhizobacter sp. Root1221]
MSLATRCTACGTVFRVVQDQLKVSEGWVRCGRCDQVFNAIEGLFDLERDAPPDWNPPPSPPQPPAAAITAHYQAPVEAPADDDDVFHLSDEDRIHSRFFQPEQEDVDQTPAQTVAERDRVDFADAQFNMSMLAEVEGDNPSTERPPVEAPEPIRKHSAAKAAKAAKRPPEFLREAKRKARWRSPQVRIGLSMLVLLLAGSLVGQAAMHFRDVVAARWPQTRPWLVAACEPLACTVGLPHRIDELSVESSALSPAGGGASYRLSVVLRNRGSLPLALPSVDLSLTDPDGQLVSRRALSPADFRADPARIAAGSETTLQLLLDADGPRISGYTVEIFYP